MRCTFLLALLSISACLGAEEPRFPLSSGTYRFQWRDAEFIEGPGFRVVVQIKGVEIRVVNQHAQRQGVPVGELASGVVMWHAGFGKWIIGNRESDRTAPSVGSCSDGPAPYVIDLVTREIWSCEWGP
jgi:hypothetical protein